MSTLGLRLAVLGAFTALTVSACGDDTPSSPDASASADASVALDASASPDGTTGGSDATGGADAGASGDASGADALPGDAPVGDSGATGPRSIVFIHTNDEHSHELGFAPEVDDFPTMQQDGIGGGVLRRTVVIDQIKTAARAASSPFAVVSSGDQMMGSLFHLANPARGIDYALATLLGYDVMTLGNHEFDLGVASLAGALRTGGIDATGGPGVMQIPIVTSNIRFSRSSAGDDQLAALYSVGGDATHPLRRTFIKRHGNVRVGYIGLLGIGASYVAPFKTPVRFSMANTGAACSTDADCPGAYCLPPASNPLATSGQCSINKDESDPRHFAALVADAAGAVGELRAQNVDLVVALSHVGVDERELATLDAMGMSPADAQVSEEILLAKAVDQALAAQSLRGIDVIIGGHSHTALAHPLVIPSSQGGAATYIVQAGRYGQYVGKLRLTQADGSAPWLVDDTFSGLAPVDDTIDPTLASPFTAQILSGAIEQVISGLEATAVATAGDNLIFPGEQCDGAELPNQGQCAGFIDGATAGTLACFANRQLNLRGCTFSANTSCGNGTLEAGESCDGADLGGKTCEGLGYEPGGTLGCNTNCTFDPSACLTHFPSLLEVVVNFASNGAPVRDQNGAGDLFFYSFGHTNFALPEASPSQESNLIDLVTDASRYSSNQLIPELSDDPVRVAISANGVIRDGIAPGRTGALTVEDLFRVLPLGVSPVETTPTYSLTDYWVRADELVRGLEIGVGRGMDHDDFWLGVSGAKVEYDLSRPAGDRVMRVLLAEPNYPWLEGPYEEVPVYDRDNGGYPDPARLIHVSTNFYLTIFLESFGICPRDVMGAPVPQCKPCQTTAECGNGYTCDATAHRCTGPLPGAVAVRTLMPRTSQELKEYLALTSYVRYLTELPTDYNARVPRRVCCVGAACPADRSRSCD